MSLLADLLRIVLVLVGLVAASVDTHSTWPTALAITLVILPLLILVIERHGRSPSR